MASKGADNSEARLRMLMALAVLIIVCIAIYNWVVSPQAAFVGAAQNYERVAKKTEHKIDVLTRAIKRMQCEVAWMEEFDTTAVAHFFDIDSGLQFLDNLEFEATESGCSIVSLNYMLPETVEVQGLSCDELEVTSKKAEMEVVGSYSNIAGFLKRLNRHSDRASISDLEIAMTSDYSAMRCTMEIKVYIIEDKELINDVEN
jgi:Tfp pilus assembly protein PilO